jgi:Peptidase A4 family
MNATEGTSPRDFFIPKQSSGHIWAHVSQYSECTISMKEGSPERRSIAYSDSQGIVDFEFMVDDRDVDVDLTITFLDAGRQRERRVRVQSTERRLDRSSNQRPKTKAAAVLPALTENEALEGSAWSLMQRGYPQRPSGNGARLDNWLSRVLRDVEIVPTRVHPGRGRSHQGSSIESPIWSGVGLGEDFSKTQYQSVTGTFTVPQRQALSVVAPLTDAQGNLENETATTWCGFDGWSNGTTLILPQLWQAGIEFDCTYSGNAQAPNAVVTYQPFFQYLPDGLNGEYTLGLSINSGDQVQIDVGLFPPYFLSGNTLIPSGYVGILDDSPVTAGNTYLSYSGTYRIDNITTGQSTGTIYYPHGSFWRFGAAQDPSLDTCSGFEAEWIVEKHGEPLFAFNDFEIQSAYALSLYEPLFRLGPVGGPVGKGPASGSGGSTILGPSNPPLPPLPPVLGAISITVSCLGDDTHEAFPFYVVKSGGSQNHPQDYLVSTNLPANDTISFHWQNFE